MERITEDDVKHVALLSRLGLSEAEAKLYTQQLGDILEYASRLPELDNHLEQSDLRVADDVAIATKNPHDLLRNAVAMEKGYVQVPAILDKESAS